MVSTRSGLNTAVPRLTLDQLQDPDYEPSEDGYETDDNVSLFTESDYADEDNMNVLADELLFDMDDLSSEEEDDDPNDPDYVPYGRN